MSAVWTIALVLIVLWVLGLVTANTLGGFIHVFLVIINNKNGIQI